MKPRYAVLTITTFLLFGISFACAEDWANWRGPEQNGISRETGLISDWSLEDGKNVLWESEIGGRATPIIMNDRIYLNCRTDNDFNDPEDKVNCREQVVCWDAKTGKVLWKDVFNVFQTDIPAPRVGWAAMVGDPETDRVYVHSVDGIFRCYSSDGDVLWEHSLLEEYGKISGYGGRTQTPIIDEDRVIVSFLSANWGETKGPSPKHYYYAFDKNNGELLWTAAPGGAPKDTNYSAPIVRVIDGTRMLIAGNADGNLYAMQARTGKPIWQYRLSKRGLNTTPATDGKYVYISHGEDNIDNTEFGRVQCIDATGKGDVTDTHGVWRTDGLKAGYTALLVQDGILYVVADTGNLFAFDSKSGEQLWDYSLGTVGKGSPVWADGKLYVMEVNGNIHILKPSREKCESLSHNHLKSKRGEGLDEIYASPAISNGRIVFVTRDRTICVGAEGAKDGKVVPLPKESPVGTEVAQLQLRPFEVVLRPGQKIAYELVSFDENGRQIGSEGSPDAPLFSKVTDANVSVSGNEVTAPNEGEDFAGTIEAKKDGLTAVARMRYFNPAKQWKWDFEGFKGVQVPPQWLRAHIKLKPVTMDDGNTVMQAAGIGKGKGRPSHTVYLGRPDMSDYTIQADVFLTEQRRQLPNIGLVANRYNLILKGNVGRLIIQSWAPHLRMAQTVKFRSDPDVWYTMKLKVDSSGSEAKIYGKVWKRDEPEPDAWTIEATDPHPNKSGNPGLYVYAITDCMFDNVVVDFEDK